MGINQKQLESVAQNLEKSRSDILMLLFNTLIVGLLLGVVANLLFELIMRVIPTTFSQPVQYLIIFCLFIAGLGTLGGILWVVARHLQRVTLAGHQLHHLEIAIPYYYDGNSVTILRQVDGVPAYDVVNRAASTWRRWTQLAPDGEKPLGEAWKQARLDKKPIDQAMASIHYPLINDLVLETLHNYLDDTLRPGMEFTNPWHLHIGPAEQQQISLSALPALWSENPFTKARLNKKVNEWNLRLLKDMTLTESNGGKQWAMRLQHKDWGDITLRFYDRPWSVSTKGPDWRPGDSFLLGRAPEFVAKLNPDNYYVLGNNIEIETTLYARLWQHNERFQHWMAGLICVLEQELDWQYFLRTRQAKMIEQIYALQLRKD